MPRAAQTDLARPHPRNAAEVQDGSQYSVLLIITDGVISDMAQTKEAIVNVSFVGGLGTRGICLRDTPSHSFRETLGLVPPLPALCGTIPGFWPQHLEGLAVGWGRLSHQ